MRPGASQLAHESTVAELFFVLLMAEVFDIRFLGVHFVAKKKKRIK